MKNSHWGIFWLGKIRKSSLGIGHDKDDMVDYGFQR
jgi:hypothetical protein